VDRIHVTAGTTVSAPIRLMNRSKAIWGEDAHEFIPARWMSSEVGIPDKAKEIHGYAHLLTFVDGPRTCLGKQFAITEFKVGSSILAISGRVDLTRCIQVVLATLIRHYEFRLRDGADTKFEKVLGILFRPKIAGEEGSKVPILVKRVD
jgi:cytochrome P450